MEFPRFLDVVIRLTVIPVGLHPFMVWTAQNIFTPGSP